MRRNLRGTLALAIILLATGSCGSSPGELPEDDELAVLFVGNSLTEANDLPGMVAALAEAAGIERFRHQAVLLGGAALEDHWRNGEAIEALEGSSWDVVVLQQGPSSLATSRANLIEWTERFAERIRARGARPALYMVWPPAGGNWDGVTRSYTDAAAAVDGFLFPAGEAVRAALRVHPTMPLLAPDRFHPATAGSYLAALVIIGGLTGRSTVGLSPNVRTVDLPPGIKADLERFADDANRDFGVR
jgi:hypothetical protein